MTARTPAADSIIEPRKEVWSRDHAYSFINIGDIILGKTD